MIVRLLEIRMARGRHDWVETFDGKRMRARLCEKLSAEKVASMGATMVRSLAQMHVKRRQHK
jgi:hypothetical protein